MCAPHLISLGLFVGILSYGMKTMYITQLRRTLTFLPNTNMLVAMSKGTQAVKLCSGNILQILVGLKAILDYYNDMIGNGKG